MSCPPISGNPQHTPHPITYWLMTPHSTPLPSTRNCGEGCSGDVALLLEDWEPLQDNKKHKIIPLWNTLGKNENSHTLTAGQWPATPQGPCVVSCATSHPATKLRLALRTMSRRMTTPLSWGVLLGLIRGGQWSTTPWAAGASFGSKID